MRNTIQRKMILDTVKASTSHPTAETVFKAVSEQCPGISVATVYRNLNLLAGLGLIKKISIPGGADRFDGNVGTHYHIICKECGKFSDIDLSYIEQMQGLIKSATGYEVDFVDTVFIGFCFACITQKSLNKGGI